MATNYAEYRADEALIDTFYVTPFDKAGARRAMVARIDRTIKQLKNEKVRGKDDKDFETLEANGVSYVPTLNGVKVDLLDFDGQTGFHATRANLQTMLPLLKKDIENGEHDDKLQAAFEASSDGSETPAAKPVKTRAPSRRGSGLGTVAKPDDAEWMAKFREFVGEPDPSIIDPIPNSKGTKWVAGKNAARGVGAAAAKKLKAGKDA